MEVTIAKALKLKSRLVSLSKNTYKAIQENNSVVAGCVRKVNVQVEVENYIKIQKAIVQVKTAISIGNIPIQSQIFKASELRTEAQLWQSLCTDEGVVQACSWGRTMNSEPISKTVIFDNRNVQEKLKKIQKTLDLIQDELDKFNHTTLVEIPDTVFELV